MRTASLENCKELYELSGWDDVYWKWCRIDPDNWQKVTDTPKYLDLTATDQPWCPAYDLGYLLRKLKPKIVVKKKIYGLVLTNSTSDGSWIADYLSWTWQAPLPEHTKDYWLHSGNRAKLTEGTGPENATVKLCIALIKAGVLKPEKGQTNDG